MVLQCSKQHSLEQSLREHSMTLEARVTERTAELKQSEQRFRTVLDNMDDMAYIATDEYVLTFMNRAMQEIFGCLATDLCAAIGPGIAAHSYEVDRPV